MEDLKSNDQSSKTSKKIMVSSSKLKNWIFKHKFLIAFILVLLLTAIALGSRTWRYLLSFTPLAQNQPQKVQTTVKQEILVRRSQIPNIIYKATTAKIIDVKTGKVIKASNLFTLQDKTVYLVLDLASPKIGTHIDYIRYLNGRYVDHGEVQIDKPNTNNLTFKWGITKPVGSFPDGKYKIATYTDGILEKRVNYTVSKGNLGSVNIEDNISPNDPEYYLAKTTTNLNSIYKNL